MFFKKGNLESNESACLVEYGSPVDGFLTLTLGSLGSLKEMTLLSWSAPYRQCLLCLSLCVVLTFCVLSA